MKELKSIKNLFVLAVLFLFIMSSTFLLMPFAVNIENYVRAKAVAVGITFWISLFFGYLMVILAAVKHKKFIKNHPNVKKVMSKRPGMFNFFSNIPACITDVICIVSVLAYIIISNTQWANDYVAFVLIFLFSFSLNMHCLFNGNIYKTIKYSEEIES